MQINGLTSYTAQMPYSQRTNHTSITIPNTNDINALDRSNMQIEHEELRNLLPERLQK